MYFEISKGASIEFNLKLVIFPTKLFIVLLRSNITVLRILPNIYKILAK